MSDDWIRRRDVLLTFGATGIGSIAGCTGDRDDSPNDDDTNDSGDDGPDGADTGTDDEPGEGATGGPSIAIEDLSVTPSTVRVTEQVKVTTTLTNTGDTEEIVLNSITRDGESNGEHEITVEAGQSMETETTYEALRVGEHDVTSAISDADSVVDSTKTTVTAKNTPTSFVDVSGTAFTLEGEAFYVSGAEPKPPYIDGFGHPNPDELREIIFDGLADIDATVARLHGYSYASRELGTPFPGMDNEAFFERFDRAIVEAKRRGIRLAINIINGAPHYHLDPEEHFGMHVPAFVHHVDSADEIDDFFVNEECIELYKNWVTELLTRENHLTGVEYRNDPTIMLWELGNEIEWEAGWEREDGPSIRSWIEAVAPHVQDVMNGNQLLTTGVHGWPDGRNDFHDDHVPESIDVCSIHWWAPGPLHYEEMTPEESAALFEDLIETAHGSLEKPVWIGEYNWGYGDETDPEDVDDELIETRNEALKTWHDRFDAADVAGVALHELGSKEIHEELFNNAGPGSSTVYADAHDSTVAELQRYAGLLREKSGNEPPETEHTTYHIAPDGADENDGSVANPLNSIQEGLDRAHPGDTIQLAPGQYFEETHTVRSGNPDAPITITGPTDAIWTAHQDTNTLFDVAHSHIHVHGVTMDGLKHESRAFESGDAYADMCVQISPHRTHLHNDIEPVDYLEDVVIEPSRMGNSSGNMIFITRLRGGSIGGFEVIGPAGMDFHPDVENPTESHVGEIIYVGTTLDDLDARYPWDSLDRSQDIRIHDIDNSAGYHHSQFIDLKIGTERITIEHCTDRESGSTTDGVEAAAIEVKGNDHTIRWNDLGDCLWGFIFGAWVPHAHEHHADGENWARGNDIYGNYIHGYAEDAFMFYEERTEGGSGPVSPEDQGVFCGNEIEGADGKYAYATGPCEDDVPTA